ncbi:hypothetical protein GPL15_24755 [Clostridium sp. MCC353]|uniref:sensor histidine kinase n=1 Tax=Clostridium sp. MCC353 TaxID=2592646 RepID=UPI001C02E0DB|nr:histidine kinase [Clostridium sp. MCC353]MBT9779690.1 hypothetical protein [Clostridium sp. MCC353]
MQISIKKVLNITLALVLALLTAMLTYMVTQFYVKSTFETLGRANTERLQLVSQKADALVTGSEAVARLLYQDENILGTILSNTITPQNTAAVSANIDLLCTKYYSAFQQFDLTFDVVCFGNNGFQYSSCGYSDSEFKQLSSYSWFTKQRAMGAVDYSVTNFVPFPKDGEKTYCYAIVRNIYQVRGNYAGSIIVFVKEDVFKSVYENLMQENSTFYLLNEYSTVISSSDASQTGTSPEAIRDYLFVRGKDSYVTYTNDAGMECFCAKYTSPVTGWTMFEQIPLNDVMAPIQKACFMIAAIAAVLYLLSVFVISIVSESISRPIRIICGEMESSISRQFAHLQIRTKISEIRSIGISYNHLCDEISKLLCDVRDAEKRVNDAKFNFLKAQINPHFLYNTLFSVKCTIAMNEPEHACEMLTLLISILQNSVSSNKSDNTLLEETIIIGQYVRLQNLRYDNKVHFRMDLPKELMDLTIPRFLIQPLVENVFLHAIPLTGEAIELMIRFRGDDKIITIEVCDTGIGFGQEDMERVFEQASGASFHIGLKNIQDRIQLLYGADFGLCAVHDQHYHTIMVLRMPRQKGGDSIDSNTGS